MHTLETFPDLSIFDRFAFDTEATGLHYPSDKVFGASISTPDGNDYYWDVRLQPEFKRWFNKQMKGYKGLVVMHNAHFDCKMGHGMGLDIPLDRVRCTQIQACLINEHEMEYSLDALARKYLGEHKVDDIYEKLAALFGGRATRPVQMPNLHRAPAELVSPYAKQDTALTLRLYDWQAKEIDKEGLQEVIDFEFSIFPTLQRMTRRGVRVDLEAAEAAILELDVIIAEDQAKINEMVGFELNVNSSPQIKKIFEPVKTGKIWIANNGYAVEETKKGGPSIPSAVLREMTNDPKAQLIVDIRSNIKTRDTFLKGHIIGHAVDGRVYPSINQCKGEDGGTGTGRLSYQDPALQQIPSRNKRVAKIVKTCFLPEIGHRWGSTDIQSCDVRVFAHLANNEIVIKAYGENPEMDFHQFTADLMGIKRNATYSGEVNAKQLNLSMIFNSGNGAIAEKLGLPFTWESFTSRGELVTYKKAGKDAEAAISMYHDKVKGVKDLAERAKRCAEQRGWCRTHSGRRMRFPRGHKSYAASGLVIQGTAADINKTALVVIEAALARHDSFLLLNVHDSFEFSIPLDKDPAEVCWDVIKSFQDSFPWVRVPMLLELNGTGKNYFEASTAKGQYLY
jgi:DNA polymerase I-like protein with 3'-5' exonuclease and polymerase domains